MNKTKNDSTRKSLAAIAGTRHINPRKLLMSKWTALQPHHKEKHFIVIKVEQPDDPKTPIQWVEIEAVMTHTVQRIPWHSLRDTTIWQQGWR